MVHFFAQKMESVWSNLARRLNEFCDEQPFVTTWALKDLRGGREADRQGWRMLPSASVRKTAILMAALAAAREGTISLDAPATITAEVQDRENFSGCFQHLTPGLRLTVRDLVIMMIIVSDNSATAMIAEMVGLDRVNALCGSIGMTGTTHRHGRFPTSLPRDHPVDASNATTASGEVLLFDLILQGTSDPKVAARLGCATEDCATAIQILLWQKYGDRIPRFLPNWTKVAHKTGVGHRNWHDAGIVYQGGEPLYILAALTENVPEALPDGTAGRAAASELIGRIAREAWDALVPSA